MCIVCIAASSPEIVVVVGGYAAARAGHPVERIRALMGRQRSTEAAQPAEAAPAPRAEQSPVTLHGIAPSGLTTPG